MVRRSEEKTVEYKDKNWGGEGITTIRSLLNSPEEMYGKGRAFAHSSLEPGCSIGFHYHKGDGEVYYILGGRGEFNDNGTITNVQAGDVTITHPGQGHAMLNTGGETLHYIALILYE